MEKFENKVTLKVVSPTGEVVEHQGRTFKNVPYLELFPQASPVIIDWSVLGREIQVADVKKWVQFDGRKYCAAWAWGSAVKRGQSIGLQQDWMMKSGLLKYAERTIKSGRYLMGQGMYGALKGTAQIKVVKPGVMIGDYPVADGHSLIRRSLAEKGHEGYDTITLGRAVGSDTEWQWIPWTEPLRKEMQPFIDDMLMDMSLGKHWKYAKGPHVDERRELIDVDDSMEYHPYCAYRFSKDASRTFARCATAIQLPTTGKVAVPTTAPKAALWGAYKLTRFPVDSTGSTQAVKCKASKKERDRIDSMEVVQYTIATKSLMANGCFGVIDDELFPEGIDIVLCRDDIKLGSLALGKREITGVITFNQWYAAGCAIGLNPTWGKRMGADFDGDLVYITDLAKLPVLFEAIASRPHNGTEKLEKTKSGLSYRPQMLVDSMRNLVGFACNVARLTFTLADRERTARLLGFADEEALNTRLNLYMKIGTDGFKTRPKLNGKFLMLKEVYAMVSNMQQNLGVFTSGLPWVKWPNEYAWERTVPHFAEDGEDKDEWGLVIPSYYDGTVPQIMKLTIPALTAYCGNPVKVYPLSRFKNWAPRGIPDGLAKEAHQLQMEFNARVHVVNFTWGDQVIHFKTWWQGRLGEWAKQSGHSRLTCVYAMWREAHSSRSHNASAASVFIGFPEEAMAIIRDKPGKTKAQETVVLGLQYVFDSVPGVIDAEVTVLEFKQKRGDQELIRKIVCVEEYPGKKAPRKPYPTTMLGMVEIQATQPENGSYIAHIVRAGHGQAWHAQLRSI